MSERETAMLSTFIASFLLSFISVSRNVLINIKRCKFISEGAEENLTAMYHLIFVAGNATYKSPCRSVGPSIGPSVPLCFFFAFLSSLKVEKFRFEYFMDADAIAQIIAAPAQLNTAPAQLNTAPPQPPATGVVVYTALLIRNCSKTSKARRTGLIAI